MTKHYSNQKLTEHCSNQKMIEHCINKEWLSTVTKKTEFSVAKMADKITKLPSLL
jgi:hypothetical protein